MIQQRSKVVATYSKRRQFRRVIRDNWHESENTSIHNVFSTSGTEGGSKPFKHLTSTPIGKVKEPIPKNVTPLNLLESGSFDTPLDDRYPLKDISHPRQVTGKRACRRPPILNVSPQPDPPEHSQIDLFCDGSGSTNTSAEKENTYASPSLQPKDNGKQSKSSLISISSQPDKCSFSPEPNSLADTDFSSQLLSCPSERNYVYKTPANVVTGSVVLSQNTPQEKGLSLSIMEVSGQEFSPERVSEGRVSEERVSEGRVSEERVSPEGVFEERVSPERVSPERVSEEKDDEMQLSLELSNMSVQDGEVSVPVQQSTGVTRQDCQTSVLEMSVEDCVKEEKIAALDRSLLLATTIPSYTKLLSQCTRVKDLMTLIHSDVDCIRKIGEGSFGEVYMGEDTVYKILPVGGDVEINGVEQTSFENAFQEIVVSRMLSELAGDKVQMGKAFCQLKDVVFCKGSYPEVLLLAWDEFQGTENQRPDMLPEEQLYVVLLSRYSGVQLEEYCKQHKLTPDQAHSVVRQVCCSLAAAEQRYEFEHRDLHWGNVLIAETALQHVEFTQDGDTFILRSHGLLATVIDFTFSRLETAGCLNFVDLEQEEWLFQGDVKVDIQYRVYRDMRSACRKNWAKFTPKTNVLWLLYLIDKMNIKIRSQKLRRLRQSLQSAKSASAALPIAFRSL